MLHLISRASQFKKVHWMKIVLLFLVTEFFSQILPTYYETLCISIYRDSQGKIWCTKFNSCNERRANHRVTLKLENRQTCTFRPSIIITAIADGFEGFLSFLFYWIARILEKGKVGGREPLGRGLRHDACLGSEEPRGWEKLPAKNINNAF